MIIGVNYVQICAIFDQKRSLYVILTTLVSKNCNHRNIKNGVFLRSTKMHSSGTFGTGVILSAAALMAILLFRNH